MRLVSCHIENFGKLQDFTYIFEDALTVIFAENGWGKSTFAAFLKVMFYGFDGENRRKEEGNERLRYKPWGGGVYGGSVIFSCGGRTYRLLRTFGARRREDTFALYDEETGLSSSDFTSQTGEELFGIDRDSFRRTVFWSQSDHETFATTSIQAKIGDLSARTDDLPAYDEAVKRLRREAERLRPDRAGGRIRKKEDSLRLLMADEARLPQLNAQLRDCAGKESALADDLDAIRAQRRQYLLRAASSGSPQPSSTGAGPECPRDREELWAARKERAALIEEERSIQRRGERRRREYIRVKRELQQELREETGRRKRLRASALASIALSVMVALLCSAGFLPTYFLLLCVLLPVGSLAVLWRVGLRGRSVPETETITRLRREKESCAGDLASLRDRLYRTREALEKNSARIDSLRADAQMRSEAAPAAESCPDLENAGPGRPAPEPAAQKASFSEETAQALAALDRQEEVCRAQLHKVRQQSSDLSEMIRECEAGASLIPGLQSEISALREQYETCVRTLSYLEEARNLFASRYMSPFLRSFGRYYSMLTGESAESVQTDADFAITVMDKGLPRDPSLMSEGTRDLIGLCRRMAMIDAMYPGEKPFLVLDDPFSNLDDERVKGGLRFLHSASLEYQILYLTCHKSRF